MATTKQTIGSIRDTLNRSGWLRNDYAGHTAEEFKRANVGERLTAMIADLEALSIAPRFAHEVERQAHEVKSCRAVIARWAAAQAAPAAPSYKPTCQEGGTRHVFLGGPNCVMCGKPFTK